MCTVMVWLSYLTEGKLNLYVAYVYVATKSFFQMLMKGTTMFLRNGLPQTGLILLTLDRRLGMPKTFVLL